MTKVTVEDENGDTIEEIIIRREKTGRKETRIKYD